MDFQQWQLYAAAEPTGRAPASDASTFVASAFARKLQGPSANGTADFAASSFVASTTVAVASSSDTGTASFDPRQGLGNRFDCTDAAIHQGKSFVTATSSNANY